MIINRFDNNKSGIFKGQYTNAKLFFLPFFLSALFFAYFERIIIDSEQKYWLA
jgi:hypothetical protein